MSGTFSSQSSPSFNDDIPFYNAEYEETLWSNFEKDGKSESVVSSTPGAPSNMSGHNLEDPCYFLDFAEEQGNLQEDTGFFEYEFTPYFSTEVEPVVQEPVQAIRNERYEPYTEPSSQQNKKKRGRPMKSSSGSKMANYSRQYREMKKNQLASSEVKIQALEHENEELRAQMQKMTFAMKKLEDEVKRLQRRSAVHQSVPAVIAVDQRF